MSSVNVKMVAFFESWDFPNRQENFIWNVFLTVYLSAYCCLLFLMGLQITSFENTVLPYYLSILSKNKQMK